MVNGTSSPPESGVGTSLSSTTPSPRPGEDSSTARLLRHLQGRVQQLRAQNDSLRKSSENESLNDSHCSVMSTESVRYYLGTRLPSGYSAHYDCLFQSRSDEGLMLETSASETLYGGQFILSTHLIESNYHKIVSQ